MIMFYRNVDPPVWYDTDVKLFEIQRVWLYLHKLTIMIGGMEMNLQGVHSWTVITDFKVRVLAKELPNCCHYGM